MDKKESNTEIFIKGLVSLTGIPLKKIKKYAGQNNLFNVLEHPYTIEPNEKQIKKIELLNEFISVYNLLKLFEKENEIRLDSSTAAGEYFTALLSGKKEREEFWAVFLAANNSIIELSVISKGTVSEAVVYPREILKRAINCDCRKIIIAHNHPGGIKKPSLSDIEVTQKLIDIFYPIDIRVVDHIIVSGGGYISFAEKGYIPDNICAAANYLPIKLEENIEYEEICYSEGINDDEWEI
ncbi:UNVERIFIED_CONTAM: DNA repair protein RadC [Acetivibrio alkalicellulosi]